MNAVEDSFTLWKVEEFRIISPEYKNIGRNALCPCGSGKKYRERVKKCLRIN
jgi:uncharacterized protein YecA (UPF0149 family)